MNIVYNALVLHNGKYVTRQYVHNDDDIDPICHFEAIVYNNDQPLYSLVYKFGDKPHWSC